MHAFEKTKRLFIWDWYFTGRMETIRTKKKVNERKGFRNIAKNYVFTQ